LWIADEEFRVKDSVWGTSATIAATDSGDVMSVGMARAAPVRFKV